MRGDYGITYDLDVLRLIDAFQERGLFVGSVCVTMYTAAPEVEAFEKRLNSWASAPSGTIRSPATPTTLPAS